MLRPWCWPLLLLIFPLASDAFLVCYAFFGPVNDLGWTYSQNLARAWADAVLETDSQYVESVKDMSLEQQRAVMESFISRGCGVVFAGSEIFLPLALEYADRHPASKIVVLGGMSSTPNLPNFGAAYLRTYQSRYIAGMVAAMQPEVRTIGYVGSYYHPDSIRSINAFALGVRSVRPDAHILVTHVGSWYIPRLEEIAGRRLIGWHGVDLLTYDSDSTTIVKLAKDMGKLSIAVKSDGTALFGDSNLLSVLYVWNQIFVELVSAAMNDTQWALRRNEDVFVGFEKGGLSLGTYSSKVPAAARLQATRLMNRFSNGEDRVFCGAFESFCPKDAGSDSPWPCDNVSRRVPNISAGEDCLSDTDVRSMTWLLQDAVVDLGLMQVPAVCPPGTKLDALSESLCVTCPAGLFTEGNDTAECRPCAAGFYSDLVGATRCEVCASGSFSNFTGLPTVHCTSCMPGQFSDAPGASECRRCPPGFSAPATGSSQCTPCDEGAFTDAVGGTSCEPCPSPKTSRPGAASAAQCVCPAGTYTLADGSCAPCPRGLRCAMGPQQPEVLPGFWSAALQGPDFVFSVYRCRDGKECPGGQLGTCAANRHGTACAYCRPGTKPVASSGECQDCKGSSTTSITLAATVIVVLAVLLLLYSNMDVARSRRASVDLSVCLGQAVIASQLSSLVGNVPVPWLEPLRTFVKVVSVLSFKLETLNVGCVLPEDRSTALLLVKLAIFPVVSLAFCVLFGVTTQCRGVPFQLDRLLDALGVVFVMIYLTLTIISLLPFRCLENPNGSLSLSDDPGVICGNNPQYVQMAALGSCGLLVYTIGFFSIVMHATARFPQLLATGQGERVMVRYRFLFHRFAPSRYYYAALYLCRNFLLAMVPVGFANYAHRQIIAFATVMLCSLTVQSWLQPWRSPLPNAVDAALSTCIALCLSVAGILLPVDRIDMPGFLWDLQVFGAILLGAALAALVGAVTLLATRRLLPAHSFMAFLTHHKLACAAGARLMKLELEQLTGGRVFLDSDCLTDLMSLLDVVRCGTKRLVVLLTRETLWRPWCAGEIAIAHVNQVPILAVAYDCYEEPTEDDLDLDRLAAGSKWAVKAFAPVALQGVTLEAVRAAYVWVRSQPKLRVKRAACLLCDANEGAKTVWEVARFCVSRPMASWIVAPSVLDREQANDLEVVVIADRMEGEAVSSARFLTQMLQVRTHKPVGDLLYIPPEVLLDSALETVAKSSPILAMGSKSSRIGTNRSATQTKYLVVLLTPGAFSSAGFAQCLVGARRAWPKAELITCRVPGMQFPTAEAFEQGILQQVCTAADLPIQELAAEYSLVLSLIAMPVSPDAHHTIISTELDRIAQCLRPPMTSVDSESRRVKLLNAGNQAATEAILGRPSRWELATVSKSDSREPRGLHVETEALEVRM